MTETFAREPDGTLASGTGDCFPAAAALVIHGDELVRGLSGAGGATRHVYACHAKVLGTSGEVAGERYWHAWVEIGPPDDDESVVVDWSNGHRYVLARHDYYRIGSIDPAKVLRYTRRDVRYWLTRTGIAGPWEQP